MSRSAEVVAARARLVAVLGEIAERAAGSAIERCPYRDHRDACGFMAGCRNQQRQGKAGVVLCSGGRLNPEPAHGPTTTTDKASRAPSTSAVRGRAP